MLGEVLLNEDRPIYEYQNTELTVNDQTWLGGITGLHNLERRRNEDMPTSDRLLFHQCQEHGIFRTFSLLFFSAFCLFYPST